MNPDAPSPNLGSPTSIFRPWQAKCSESSEDDTNKDIINSSQSGEEYFKSVEVASTSKSQNELLIKDAFLLTKIFDKNSLNFERKLEVKLPNEILKNYSPSLSESLVTSSTSCHEEIICHESNSYSEEKYCHASNTCHEENSKPKTLETSTRRSQKRKSEELDEISFKRVMKPSFVIPTPSFPGTSTSGILQGIPPTGSQLHSATQYLPANPFGSFVPLLEPPIFVSASEVERVCARRPRPKRFSCSECGAAFSNRGQLSGHCRIHTGERPFRCTQPGCGKKFTRNEELTRHRRIHSGLRPFPCGICPKRFGRKDHLKKHLRTHTRHVIPHFPPLQPFDHLQHLQHVQHLQQIQHLQQLQQFQFQIPLMHIPLEGKAL